MRLITDAEMSAAADIREPGASSPILTANPAGPTPCQVTSRVNYNFPAGGVVAVADGADDKPDSISEAACRTIIPTCSGDGVR